MTATNHQLTPYDTGSRCEPKVWPTPTRLLLERSTPAARLIEEDRFGKVDFEDDESRTVAVAYMERTDDGTHVLHVTPLGDDDEVAVQLHLENGLTRTLEAPHH